MTGFLEINGSRKDLFGANVEKFLTGNHSKPRNYPPFSFSRNIWKCWRGTELMNDPALSGVALVKTSWIDSDCHCLLNDHRVRIGGWFIVYVFPSLQKITKGSMYNDFHFQLQWTPREKAPNAHNLGQQRWWRSPLGPCPNDEYSFFIFYFNKSKTFHGAFTAA